MSESHLAAVRYKARPGWRLSNARAERYGPYLDHLSQKHGKLTARVVVKASALRSAPTHDYFNWNDKSAANEYRLDQARKLMQSIVIVNMVNGREMETRQFYNVSVREIDDRNSVPLESGPYIASGRVLSDTELRRRWLEKARIEAINWRDRYREFCEVAKICQAIETTYSLGNGQKRSQSMVAA